MSVTDQLDDLDNTFIAFYEATRRHLLEAQKQTALIVVNGDHMVLFHRGGDPEVITGLRPFIYTKLKTLGHVPLAIYCRLMPEAGRPALSQETLGTLADYRRRLGDSAALLDTQEYVERGDLPRPVTVYERALAFLDMVLTDAQVSEAKLDAFAGSMAADVQLMFAAAARAQVDAVHERILELRRSVLSDQEWRDLRVVVMGPHMAHKDELFLQYFSRVLHTPKYTDKRLVYFEGEDQQAALDLLGTTLIDLKASSAFFKDENRLHRDVLADATRRYLQELASADDHFREIASPR